MSYYIVGRSFVSWITVYASKFIKARQMLTNPTDDQKDEFSTYTATTFYRLATKKWVRRHAVAHYHNSCCVLSETDIVFSVATIYRRIHIDIVFTQAAYLDTMQLYLLDFAGQLHTLPATVVPFIRPVPVKHPMPVKQVASHEGGLMLQTQDNQIYHVHPKGNKIRLGNSHPMTLFLPGNDGMCRFISPYAIHLPKGWDFTPLIDWETGDSLEIVQAEYNEQLNVFLLVTSAGELWVADGYAPRQLQHLPISGVALHAMAQHKWFFVTCVGGHVGLVGHSRNNLNKLNKPLDWPYQGWYWHPIPPSTLKPEVRSWKAMGDYY